MLDGRHMVSEFSFYKLVSWWFDYKFSLRLLSMAVATTHLIIYSKSRQGFTMHFSFQRFWQMIIVSMPFVQTIQVEFLYRYSLVLTLGVYFLNYPHVQIWYFCILVQNDRKDSIWVSNDCKGLIFKDSCGNSIWPIRTTVFSRKYKSRKFTEYWFRRITVHLIYWFDRNSKAIITL
jgi:hypothetical protein